VPFKNAVSLVGVIDQDILVYNLYISYIAVNFNIFSYSPLSSHLQIVVDKVGDFG